jgi:hypothetical protein
VIAQVNLNALHYRRNAERNDDSLRALAALFDGDGGYVAGSEQTVNLHLRDQSLKGAGPGVTLRWEFNVNKGTYQIRLVIREADGNAMTAANRPLLIQ